MQQEHRESEERGPREQRQCNSRPELLIVRQLLSTRERERKNYRESASQGKSDMAAEESEGSETETDCAGVSCRESEGRQERRVAARVREVAERDAGCCQRGQGTLRSKSRRGKWFKKAQRACVAMRLYCCVFVGRKGACVAVRVPGVPCVPCLHVLQAGAVFGSSGGARS